MIEIVQEDITTLAVDAIVNAANKALRGGGGVDGAIHRAAGPELLEELRRYPGCKTGDAVLTAGYKLPARYVIHAVGPIWHGGAQGERELLEKAYRNSFARARERHDIASIAFPAISTGIYAFPKRDAAEIGLGVMRANVHDYDRIVACLFDDESFAIYRELLG